MTDRQNATWLREAQKQQTAKHWQEKQQHEQEQEDIQKQEHIDTAQQKENE